jgi:hypothetical protein
MSTMNESGGEFKAKQLLENAQEMIDFVQRACHRGEAAHEVEIGLFRKLLAMGYELMELFFALCGDGDVGEQITHGDGRKLKRLEQLHEREYLSVFGLFVLSRVVYGTREGQKMEYAPLDARLSLPQSKFSYVLQDWDQSLVVEMPYAKVEATLAKILGLSQSVNSLERINRKMAATVDEFWAAQAVPPAADEGALLVLSADGKGVPIRREAEGAADQRPAPGASEEEGEQKKGKKKMSLVGAAYTVDPYIRSPEQVLDALFREPDASSKPPARPKPMFKHIRASLLRDAADTMAPSFDEIFGWLAQEVRHRNRAGEKPMPFLMDGQEALWNALPRYFPGLQFIEILDLLHVCGYIWAAAHLFYKKKSAQAVRFAKERMLRILQGDVQAVIRGLRWKGTHENLSRKRQEELTKICGYLEKNSHRMAYDEYLAAGYPIASGVIEGACRNVVKDRMERSGMRWILDGAHSMLGLRCIHLSGLWDEFRDFRIDRECAKLYPSPSANDDAYQYSRIA